MDLSLAWHINSYIVAVVLFGGNVALTSSGTAGQCFWPKPDCPSDHRVHLHCRAMMISRPSTRDIYTNTFSVSGLMIYRYVYSYTCGLYKLCLQTKIGQPLLLAVNMQSLFLAPVIVTHFGV